ncbi:Glutamine transport ATP-binding protein GlnQ [bioreactor metagenome]|uniref:ABC transporter, ATP-binding protein n=2 Tax=root TaxID=1 RepID=A0A098B3W1_DESHA|nr:ATP-binding cassette domain-containing protein [Desulfitobacterium hafniense]MEA5024080.1 ATP-binding cassette domain-containing protein [Desulfitobacterium hafniense]CDX03534.1 ABC transporter, ATP-binding protein [Desulfitobacterium hafniense]
MLKLRGVGKTFGIGSSNQKRALDHIDLSLQSGEFVTVIGGNGAGKSTLFNCISGVYEIEEGQILLDDLDITYHPEYKRSRMIGRVFQDPLKGTAFDMTIEQNLAIALAKGQPVSLRPGATKKELALLRERLAVLDLGLEDRMKHKVGLLSGGQRQALTLLMATLVKPKILLLDEHTAALDPAIAKKVMVLTRQIVEEDKLCTLMITHNMKASLEFGSRTMMMHEGRIIMDLQGEERRQMTVDHLIEQFEKRSGTELANDRMLLA